MTGLPKSGADERRSQPQSYYGVLRSTFPFGNITNQTPIRGIVYLTPFSVPQRMILNQVFVQIATATGTMRFGIYGDVSNSPATGTKLFDSGNVGLSTVHTEATVTYIADPGQYWLGITFSTNSAAFVRSSGFAWTTSSDASFSYRAGSLASDTISLPDPCPASVTIPTAGNALFPFFITVT